MLKWLLFCYLPKNVIDAVQGEGNLSQIGSLRKKWQQLEMRISGYERDTHDTHEMPRRTETIFYQERQSQKSSFIMQHDTLIFTPSLEIVLIVNARLGEGT